MFKQRGTMFKNSHYSVFALTFCLLPAVACDPKDDDRPVVGATPGAGQTGVMTTATVTGSAEYRAARTAETTSTTWGGVQTNAMNGTTASLTDDDGTDRDKREADAEFKSVPNMKIEGDAELHEVAEGVHIVVEVENALPGQKGIHIHQTDNCSDIANKSMGEHFAPTTNKHGLPTAAQHHLGDLGNITIDTDGKGKLEITAVGANLKPNDPLSFIGKSIVIHESNDKGTGASGDAGKPIACAPVRAD